MWPWHANTMALFMPVRWNHAHVGQCEKREGLGLVSNEVNATSVTFDFVYIHFISTCSLEPHHYPHTLG